MSVRWVTCVTCKLEFSYEYAGGRLRRRCGQGRCARKPDAPKATIDCTCEECGVGFQVERRSHTAKPARFCTEKCRAREYWGREPRKRVITAEQRERMNAHGRMRRAEKVAQMKADGTYRYCANCGGDMRQNATYCMEPPCREVAAEAERLRINASNRAYQRRYKERTGLSNAQRYRDRDYNKNYNYRERYPDRAKHYDHVRRARMANCERESFPDSLIFERDEWVCGICSESVDRSLKYPDPKSASLDHIIPLSKGGGHTMGNVQLAHLGCNCRKHDKLPGELVAAN